MSKFVQAAHALCSSDKWIWRRWRIYWWGIFWIRFLIHWAMRSQRRSMRLQNEKSSPKCNFWIQSESVNIKIWWFNRWKLDFVFEKFVCKIHDSILPTMPVDLNNSNTSIFQRKWCRKFFSDFYCAEIQ